jgi:formylglycine-generating enzyme required for sulfatase activity
MEFVRAPAGSFTMGKFAPTCAPVGYQDNVTEAQHAEWVKMAAAAARPGFKATVPRAFYIGKFEVTQEQYRKVMGTNPSYFTQDKVGEPADKHPVDSIAWKAGRMKPNAWGIYDMLGNVWEWVQEWYDEQVQPGGPKGPASGKDHVLRRGAYNSHEKNIRVSIHAGGPGSVIDAGFRVVRNIK